MSAKAKTRDASAPSLWRRIDLSRWKDADKVLLCSALTLPFAFGWVLRLHQIRSDPAASPYVNRAFLSIQIPFQWTQALGHVLLVLLALFMRRRAERRLPWLVHAEIQFWILCMSVSLYIVGPFTTPFSILLLALPVIGYLLFEPRQMHYGLVTMALGSGAAIVLPQLGVLPYAPFLARAPFENGQLHPAWIGAFGVPSIFVSIVVLLIHTSLMRQLRERQAELEHLSTTDALTGLSNRKLFFDRIDEELARARRHAHPLCVLMLDADHFKAINDTFGHAVGDEVLRRLGARIRLDLRTGDLAARYGGEELAFILPVTDAAEAAAVAERLLAVARTIRFGDPGAERSLTVSVGVAELGADESASTLLARADAALYQAKRGGRDRYVVASLVGSAAGSSESGSMDAG